MYSMKRFWILITIVILGGVVFFQRFAIRDLIFSVSKEPLPIAITYEQTAQRQQTSTRPVLPTISKSDPVATTTSQKPSVVLTNALNHAVPFQSQAPFGDWSEPYENGCEEAAIIMVDHYLQGTSLSKQQMKEEIDAMVAWQVTNWSGHNNLPIEKVVELAKAFYPLYTIQILHDLSPDTIKWQLMFGTPVIIPSAGRELGNPNFRREGPLYHMLVVKGYTADGKFITNDPGTRNGADYVYTSSVLMNAINDWGGAGLSGEKTGLVMYK